MKVISRNETVNIGNTGLVQNTSGPARMNRWVMLFHDPDEPASQYTHLDFLGASAATVNKYNNSIFALTLPQGTAANERLGAEVNVLKDKWKFEFYFNSTEPSPASSATATDPLTLLPRKLKIRLVGIFQPVLLEPGNIGYTSDELFEEVDRLETHFKRGDAQGFRKIYDKTKSIGVFDPNSTDTTKTVMGPTKAVFAGNFSYKRRYAITNNGDLTTGANQSGNKVGTEITYDTATGYTSLNGGTSHGQILWYVFIEDLYPKNHTTNTYWHYLQYGVGCRIDRRTYWQDA